MTLVAEIPTEVVQIWDIGDEVYTPIGVTVPRPIVDMREIGSFGLCFAVDIGTYLNAYLPKWYTQAELLALNKAA